MDYLFDRSNGTALPPIAPVYLIEERDHIVQTLCQQLQDVCTCHVVHPALLTEESLNPSFPPSLLLIDIAALSRDAQGIERPVWHAYSDRPHLPTFILCFTTASASSAGDDLFTPPAGTTIVATATDLEAFSEAVRRYLGIFARHPVLLEAVRGQYRPSIQGDFMDIQQEALLNMLAVGSYTGILILREGVSTGLIACKEGKVVQAIVGFLTGREAFCHLFTWHKARFAFYRDIMLTGDAMRADMEELILEANRLTDEMSDFAATFPPHSVIQRVRGQTQMLLGRDMSGAEWRVLNLIDHVHALDDIIAQAAMGRTRTIHALRSLLKAHLIEIVQEKRSDGWLFS